MTFSTSRVARPSRVPSERPSALTTPAVTDPTKAERVADRDHELADLELGGITEPGRGRVTVGADDREIGEGIAADDPEVVLRCRRRTWRIPVPCRQPRAPT
jgi:hypothetical protein